MTSRAVVLGQFIGFLFYRGFCYSAFYRAICNIDVPYASATGISRSLAGDKVFPEFHYFRNMPTGLSGLVVAAIFAKRHCRHH